MNDLIATPTEISASLWIRDTPSHWLVRRLKFSTVSSRGGVWGDDFDESGTVVLRSTEQTTLGKWEITDPARRNLSTSEREQAALRVGDLVITKSSGSADHIGKTSIVTEEVEAMGACFSNFMQRLRLCDISHPKYYWYVFNSELARAQFDYQSNSTSGLANLGKELIGELIIAEPPLSEQKDISHFLDYEITRIEELLSKRRRMLELLEEKRLAIITQAVTRGLNDVPMKPTSDYWLDEIPDHWHLTRIANLTTKITNGYVGPTRDILFDQGTRYIQSLHVKNGSIYFDRGPYYVSEEWSRAHSKSILKENDVLVVQTGAEVGQTALVTSEHEGCNCHALIIMTPRKELLRGAFLELYLRSDIGQKYLQSIQTGALNPHLNCTIIRDLYVSHPSSLDEQDSILRYVAHQTSSIGEMIYKVQKAIALLIEYRSALITSAITGKIDVRGLAEKEAAA